MDYLKECIEQNRLDIISSFIRNLSDINAVLITEDDCNLNLLHFATGVDSIHRDDVIKLILTVDELDINKHSGPGNDYFTAAHIAACFGYTTTLKLLLENGADPYLLDRENNTVWDIAAFRNNYNCILVLENEINKPQTPRKEIDDSIYFSFESFNLDNDVEDGEDETIKSLDDQPSVIYVKAVENRVITKMEEKLCQRSLTSPRAKLIKTITPKKNPPMQSPLRDNPPKKTPSRDSPLKDIPPKKSPPRNSPLPPKKRPNQKERKPRITTKVDSLNETIYTDEDFNITLIESCNDSVLEPIDPKLGKLTDQEIRQQLMRLGESPGPINLTTRNAYLRKLKILKSASVETNSPTKQLPLLPLSSLSPLSPFKPLPSYSPYINAILLDRFKFDEAKKLEKEFIEKFFSNPIGPTDFFVYLLLDPRRNSSTTNKIESNPFVRFVKSIFYIGKGKNNRPYMHLYEAAAPAKNRKPISPKVKRITEIWDQGFGVISLHIVFAMSSNEAFARESLMIDAIGINKLTNIRSGQQRINWPESKRMNLGTYLIHKAFKNLELNGERQIRRADVS